MSEGLRGFFAPHSELELVAAASTVPELLALTADLDLAILDLHGLPDKSRPRNNIRALHEAGIENILVYTTGERRSLVQEAAHAGVRGVITKMDRADVVVWAVGLAARGENAPTPEWATALDSDPKLIPELTGRELEVLRLYAFGDTAVDIAAELFLSVNYIRYIIQTIKTRYEALGFDASKKTALRDIAREQGLID
ncbi:DNA-binding response regulator [Nocardia sp. NPDC020380]|uniref:DNA-binding response regulator n=1 Tax=Nocardia sp. NPDC020380 TaxID=3364309 RepID=UPI0037BD9535